MLAQLDTLLKEMLNINKDAHNKVNKFVEMP